MVGPLFFLDGIIFRGYGAPYIGGSKPSFFHGFWGPRVMVDCWFGAFSGLGFESGHGPQESQSLS